MNQPYRGSCLCGEIRFEADGFRPRNGNCHCRMCRKFHGAAYSTFAEVARDRFRWTRGRWCRRLGGRDRAGLLR
ncbi:MAG: GFA family protein [Gammaproteobacteria bacterium]|nr:GFA family protein [Gammaproteobacteria bacterium]